MKMEKLTLLEMSILFDTLDKMEETLITGGKTILKKTHMIIILKAMRLKFDLE